MLELKKLYVILISVFILLILVARFTSITWNRMLLSSNSADGDQNAYLQLGLSIREEGKLTDGTRSPLYPALLALISKRDWSYFTWAKFFSLGLGLLTILSLFAIGFKLFNWQTGLLAAFLLSINMEFILHSSFVLAEPLLALLMLLAWFVMVKALQHPDLLRIWIIAGVLSGLIYLTKGTGPIVIACFLLTATILHTPRIWIKKSLWSYIAGFATASLPLWFYNWRTYGSPIYNFAINNVMWMDTAEEKYITDAAELPTFQTFIQNTSLRTIWFRLWDGLVGMRFSFAKALWPTRDKGYDDFLLSGGLDIIIILLIIGLVVFWRPLKPKIVQHREVLLLTTTLFAFFYVAFAWYLPGAPLPLRFLIPLVPILLLLISAGIVCLFKAIFNNPKLPGWTKASIGIATTIMALWIGAWFVTTGLTNAQGYQQNPFTTDAEFNDYNEQALVWIKTGYIPEDNTTVLWGPSHNLPIWRQSDVLHFVRTPLSASNWAELESFMTANNVSYVIVDDDMARRRSELATDLGLERTSGELLDINRFPDDWALGLVAPGFPCRWCVFRRLSGPPVITSSDYSLADDSIHLIGYELNTTQFKPGGRLEVTLYWEAQKPVSTDFTIFTQLLGPNYQLYGQIDRQPLSGHFPTTRWQPTQKFADKFSIDVSESAPPGDYILLIGLYDFDTGERATAALDNQPLPDNAIPLLQLTLQP